MSGYLHFYAQHPAIALIAEKLNESGNAFHNTADWQDETDYLGGKSACDIVQEALNAADEAFNTLAAAEGGDGMALERLIEMKVMAPAPSGSGPSTVRTVVSVYLGDLVALEQRCAGLAARVRELDEDAARLDWCQANHFAPRATLVTTGGDTSPKVWINDQPRLGYMGRSLREAIDAARSK